MAFKPKRNSFCSFRVKIICETCGKSFEVKPSLSKRKYCSQICYMPINKVRLKKQGKLNGIRLKGKTYEEIHGKEKAQELKEIRAINASKQRGKPKPGVSRALKGRVFDHMKRKRPTSHRKGISMTEEYGDNRAQEIINKRSYIIKINKSVAMENNPRWLGGISNEPYGMEFNNKLKAQIRARDGNQCQVCKTYENGRTHPVHHKDYNKENSDPSNLITLCQSCHSKTNINRDKWIIYFQREINVSSC